ncbi:polysaccharide biosynthesis/export family protein [Mitsuokella jalaludinii]|uniref:polysaccharide biosynthesis/export family protein n=1 Tax=Mitsuokella jalaludinii TaxID=187979 RepID=UPI0020CFF82B|nr:polysaccharide biosynthesis/export family protein [Mitsuokella jalaludinii]MCQ1533885.1 polysaccharide export protein [Mitsuokella jalaludinii]
MKYSLPAFTITALLLSGSAVFAAPAVPTAADVAAQTAAGTLAAPAAPTHVAKSSQAAVQAEPSAVREAASDDEDDSARYVESKEMFKTASLRHTTVSPSYRLFRGDTLSILAVGFPDGIGINSLTVGLDGYVQLPYVGSVKMEGLTLDEAKAVLMDSLTQYLRIPDLSLVITSYGPRKVYVMGEVNKPGVQTMGIDNMNAYAALATAGGWARKGRSTRIQIMRVVDGTMYYRTLNMKAYTVRHDLTQNVEIEDGDILYVPRSNGIKLDTDVLPYVNAWALYKNLTD